MTDPDAVIIGAGPNGLTAAVILASHGLAVRVYEAAGTVGGGARTQALTEPGFRHDPCSAVHPLGAGSPVLRRLPLARHGLAWLHPPLPLAHPLADGSAAVLARSVQQTAASLGRDRHAYLRLAAPFTGRWDELAADLLVPPLARVPPHPAIAARFAVRAALPVAGLARAALRGPQARALLAGLAAHAIVPLTSPPTSAIALMFAAAAHDVGWPVPAGGSQAISDALAGYLAELGGQIVTGFPVRRWQDLPNARAYLFDTSPAALAGIAGHLLPSRYVGRLRGYAYGPGVFKLDYALAGPVPWTAAAARQAGTVHLAPRYADVAAALRAVSRGAPPDPPFVIVVQPSVADPSRAPAGRHVLWAYCHVPNGWDGDATAAIERQLERFAPGFADLVIARRSAGPAELEAANANYVGGDIACGSFSGLQALARPVLSRLPYATPNPALYLCSAATPPGPGVHGMCGFHAARTALARAFGRHVPAEPQVPPGG